MLLLSVLLGAAFAWLLDAALLGLAVRMNALGRRRLRRRCRFYVNLAILIAFIVIGIVVICGIYGRVTGKWSSRAVIWLHYLTVPQLQAGVAGFVLGAVVVWLRHAIWARIQEALAPKPPDKKKHWKVQVIGGALPAGTAGGEAKGPYPWLTSIVGIAAVTLVAVVTLVIFFPEVLTRVESIKVAGVEARFAQAATRSVLVGRDVSEATYATDLLPRWAAYDGLVTRTLAPTQLLVSERWSPRAAERREIEEIRERADDFLRQIAQPLAIVIRCYKGDYDVRESGVQQRAAKIAHHWGRAFRAAKNAKLADVKTRESLLAANKIRVEQATRWTYELIGELEKDFKDRASKCGNEEGEAPKVQSPPEEQFEKRVKEIAEGLQPHIMQIASDGYAIGFVADLYLFTHRAAWAVDFLDDLGKALDTRPGSLLGQQKFYRARMEAKFAARAPLADSRPDMEHAERVLDDLIKVMVEADKAATAEKPAPTIRLAEARAQASQLATYHKRARAGVINNHLYGLVIESLGGRRLLPAEVMTLEGLPGGGGGPFELSKWLKEQPLSWLWDQHAKKTDQVAKNSAIGALSAVADLNDTLAMREIVLGTIKNDLTRERCARIPALFEMADDIYRRLELEEQRRFLAAHRILYESACARE